MWPAVEGAVEGTKEADMGVWLIAVVARETWPAGEGVWPALVAEGVWLAASGVAMKGMGADVESEG